MDIPNPQIHDPSLSSLGTDTSSVAELREFYGSNLVVKGPACRQIYKQNKS